MNEFLCLAFQSLCRQGWFIFSISIQTHILIFSFQKIQIYIYIWETLNIGLWLTFWNSDERIYSLSAGGEYRGRNRKCDRKHFSKRSFFFFNRKSATVNLEILCFWRDLTAIGQLGKPSNTLYGRVLRVGNKQAWMRGNRQVTEHEVTETMKLEHPADSAEW